LAILEKRFIWAFCNLGVLGFFFWGGGGEGGRVYFGYFSGVSSEFLVILGVYRYLVIFLEFEGLNVNLESFMDLIVILGKFMGKIITFGKA
jgi:hypothetical protein